MEVRGATVRIESFGLPCLTSGALVVHIDCVCYWLSDSRVLTLLRDTFQLVNIHIVFNWFVVDRESFWEFTKSPCPSTQSRTPVTAF